MPRLTLRRFAQEYLPQGLKLALGALLAIIIAMALGLKYSATAGIITILSILGTKRETLRVAAGRLFAFLAALAIAAVCYRLMGFTVLAFAVFLFFFSLVCCCTGWMYALSLVSVLVSHFMAEGNMALPMLVNEALLFLIGTLCGILVNLTLRANEARMRELIAGVDGDMKQLLRLAAEPAQLPDAAKQLALLEDSLARAHTLALRNLGNRLLNAQGFDLAYVDMRTRQRDILAQILTAARQITYIPAQQKTVADFFRHGADEYRMGTDVSALMEELQALRAAMKAEALPAHREEFESRAILYYMLVRLRDFLSVKSSFYQEHMAE